MVRLLRFLWRAYLRRLRRFDNLHAYLEWEMNRWL